MAMVVTRVIEDAHEGDIVSVAYNKQRKEIYSVAEGEKIIKVWDSRTGQLLRTQQGHKGMVTCVLFSATIRLLFSGSIDSTVGIWTEKGVNLQMTSTGGTVFSIAWDERRRFLLVGGNSVINIFKVDLAEARKLSQQQRSVASGLKDGIGETLQILRRVYQPLRGPDLCHTDVVKCIVVTDTGKVMSGGFDKSICIYEFDKLDKPKEAFSIKRKCHTAAIVSMAYDQHNNCVLTGSIDGSMKVWSVEGRPLDHFENINDQPVCVAYVPPTHMYWGSGRFGRLLAFDPRAPCNVTEYVRDANSLDRFKVTLLFTPLACDLVLGATHARQLVTWQHDKAAAYRVFRKHDSWVEALVIVDGSAAKKRAAWESEIAQAAMAREAGLESSSSNRGKSSYGNAAVELGDDSAELAPEVFSAGADGKVLRWQLDADQNCDVYNCIEELHLHSCAIHCITYAAELDCIITGGEDASIRLHYLSGTTRTFNDVPLPSSFQEHEGRVSGLAVLRHNVLVSTSFDRSLRVWDLNTMKPLAVVANAHDTPIQCLEYNQDREELATCGMGNKARIWDISKPAAPTLRLVLNHADHDHPPSDDEESGGGRGRSRNRNQPNNMHWLTRSDIQGLPKAANPLVDDTIKKAAHDTPEVTQIRWIPWREVWVTAADDDMIRLWDTSGQQVHAWAYSGGSCQVLYVDCAHQLLLASMLDKACYVYTLDDPIPLAQYTGHQDVVRAVSFLPTTGCYITASWDKSLRLWFCPPSKEEEEANKEAAAAKDAHHNLADEEEEEDECYVSSYEKAHPLEVPRALTEANQWQILKAIGVVEDDKGGKKGKARHFKVEDVAVDEPVDLPGTLGGKLNDLGRELLQEINALAKQRTHAMDMLESGGSAAGSSGGKGRPGQLQGSGGIRR